jgi:hypothetical protein
MGGWRNSSTTCDSGILLEPPELLVITCYCGGSRNGRNVMHSGPCLELSSESASVASVDSRSGLSWLRRNLAVVGEQQFRQLQTDHISVNRNKIKRVSYLAFFVLHSFSVFSVLIVSSVRVSSLLRLSVQGR